MFGIEAGAQRNSKGSSASKKPGATRARAVETAPAPYVSAPVPATAPAIGNYIACMDDICVSPMFPDKARCRCSSQLPRIEKVLRDIEKAQAEADRKSKELEGLMNVANVGAVNDTIGNLHQNINSIEKTAKSIAANRIDSDTLVAEGQPLYNEAHKQCQPEIAAMEKSDFDAKVKEYVSLIEKDCGAYTTILKERADAVTSLLIQTQKNLEMFTEQRNKKTNALDLPACRLEYEACIKDECGVNFRNCKEAHRQKAILQKCEDANYGKCEDVKAIIIAGLHDFMKKEIRKDDVALACSAAQGWIEGGKCVFKIIYDQSGGDKKQIEVLPGATIAGGGYLLSPGGTRSPTGTATPVPAGWGTDGFPADKALRGTF